MTPAVVVRAAEMPRRTAPRRAPCPDADRHRLRRPWPGPAAGWICRPVAIRRHGRPGAASSGSSSTEAATWRRLASLPCRSAGTAGCGCRRARPTRCGPARTATCAWTSCRCRPRTPAGAAPGTGPRSEAALASRTSPTARSRRRGTGSSGSCSGLAQAARSATQFVGEIPPGRAPDHSHPYDEVVLILQGEGDSAHRRCRASAVRRAPARTCRRGCVHCLENTGSATLRVLGVFHPADSPAAKLEQRG